MLNTSDTPQAHKPFMLCASPRKGNSYAALKLFADVYVQQLAILQDPQKTDINSTRSSNQPEDLEKSVVFKHIKDLSIKSCKGCRACADTRLGCILDKTNTPDDCSYIFENLQHAPFVAIAAPIFFYGLPAGLKGLVDRCQSFYERMEQNHPAYQKLRERDAYIILCAARQKGEQLFSGSLLSLKYALKPFKLTLKPILLRGLDSPDDFTRGLALANVNLQPEVLLKQAPVHTQALNPSAVPRETSKKILEQQPEQAHSLPSPQLHDLINAGREAALTHKNYARHSV